jgi:hypothetical protein
MLNGADLTQFIQRSVEKLGWYKLIKIN